MALLWKMICNLGDPMSLGHPVTATTHGNTLQRQRTATHCNTLQHTATAALCHCRLSCCRALQGIAGRCRALQGAAGRCKALQCVAVRCRVQYFLSFVVLQSQSLSLSLPLSLSPHTQLCGERTMSVERECVWRVCVDREKLLSVSPTITLLSHTHTFTPSLSCHHITLSHPHTCDREKMCECVME